MRLYGMSLVAAVAIGLALPAGAQTAQTIPGQSTDLSIPTSPPATPAAAPAAAKVVAAPSGSVAAAPPVDINSASAVQLDALPGIGKVRAAAIIKGRPYHATQDLLSRHILPAHIYNELKNKVTV